MKKTLAVLTVAAILSFAAPFAAHAEDSDGYVPPPPVEPSLSGSTATGVCDGDVPWISYEVQLLDPDNKVTDHDAELVITGGSNSVTIPLGTLKDNSLSGRVLWPGASVDGAGNPTGWPGWELTNGQWSETSGNFAWTRGSISATIVVNPDVAVPLSYPAATPNCANGPLLSASGPGEGQVAALPATGTSPAVWWAAGFGAFAVIGGAVLLTVRRRTARR